RISRCVYSVYCNWNIQAFQGRGAGRAGEAHDRPAAYSAAWENSAAASSSSAGQFVGPILVGLLIGHFELGELFIASAMFCAALITFLPHRKAAGRLPGSRSLRWPIRLCANVRLRNDFPGVVD